MMTAPIDPIREALPVVAVVLPPLPIHGYAGKTVTGYKQFYSTEQMRAYAEKSIAAALKAKDAEIEALRADARNALVHALSCIRWQSFGECRTPGHEGSPPSPDVAAKKIEEALAALKEPS